MHLTDSLINSDSPDDEPQFIATLDFNETMDISVIPEIGFLNDNNTYTSLAMNPFETSWVDSNSFVTEIWVLPNNNDMLELDLICQNAKDHNGNIVTDSIYPSILQSDMKGPKVLSVGTLSTIISDSLVGNANYFIDVTFNEPMNIEIKPLVFHQNEIDIHNSIQYDIDQSFFTNPQNYHALFQINDENIEVDDIDLSILFGEDFAGNIQDIYFETSFISLDTKNPSIINFESNTNVLNLNDNILEFQVLFDEEMNQNQPAQFNFNPIPIAPIILQQTDLEWLDNDSLHASYELISTGSTPATFNLNITEGADLAGNPLIPISLDDLLTIQGTLDANNMRIGEIKLYPNLISKGTRIHFKNIGEYPFLNDCALLTSDGKFIKMLNIEKQGSIWTSEPLNIGAGIYFIHTNQQSLRLVVL